MAPDRYSLGRFVQHVQDYDYPILLREVEAEAQRLYGILSPGRGRRGIAEHLRLDAERYEQQLGRLLFYLRNGRKPMGAGAHEIRQYRILAESLVERRQYKPEAITEIDEWLAEATTKGSDIL